MNINRLASIHRWIWMTEYCKKNGWNPHNQFYWEKAKREYELRNSTI